MILNCSPPCSPSCLHGTQVAPGPPSVCQTSLRGASPGHSLSCQTAWTPPDLKVPHSVREAALSAYPWHRHWSEQRCDANELLSLNRTSKHGRSNENESPARHGRHGPTGQCRFHCSNSRLGQLCCRSWQCVLSSLLHSAVARRAYLVLELSVHEWTQMFGRPSLKRP